MTKRGSGYRLDQKTYIDTQIKWWVSNNNLLRKILIEITQYEKI
jgi:hypothetical protein